MENNETITAIQHAIQRGKDNSKIALICIVVFLIMLCSAIGGAAFGIKYSTKKYQERLYEATKIGGLLIEGQAYDLQIRVSNIPSKK